MQNRQFQGIKKMQQNANTTIIKHWSFHQIKYYHQKAIVLIFINTKIKSYITKKLIKYFQSQ